MSKYSAKKANLKQFQFGSDDEDEDDVGMMNKSLNLSQKSNASDRENNLKNSVERDSFLNAFLDRDANMKHGKYFSFFKTS